MLSIGTITAGDGYQYLTKEVASGVEDYYIRGGTEPGEAQGWWLGAQREDFGVTDRLVSEQQMAGFFGAKCDPVTGERLGSRFRVYATVEERLARARDEHERWVAEDLADAGGGAEGGGGEARAGSGEPGRAQRSGPGTVGEDRTEDRPGGGAQQRGRL